MGGTVVNRSSKTLWVVETDSGPAVAHKLVPNRKSPAATDADGVKAVDGTLMSGHGSWWKILPISTANITDQAAALNNDCIACFRVEENEFGPVTFNNDDGWGEPI